VGKSKLILAATAVIGLVLSFGAGLASSARCNSGAVNQAGIGVKNSGEPTGGEGWVAVCNNGQTVPAPGKGSVEVGGSLDDEEGYVDVDGDPSNTGAECTDGFIRAELDGFDQEARFYNGPDGSASDTNPNQTGNQAAQPKSPDEVVTSTMEDCQ